MTTVKVSWGPSSIIGFLAAAAAAIVPIIAELADATRPLNVPPSTWIILSSVLTAVTVLGRMYQAAQAAGAGVVQVEGTVVNPAPPLPPTPPIA